MEVFKYIDKILYSFFGLFFIFYVGKFGISNLVIPSTSAWQTLFNLGVWFVLVSYCINHVLPEPDWNNEKKKKEVKTNGTN